MAKRIHLLAIDMGYGHQRAAHPLSHLSDGEIITINDYPGISDFELKFWSSTQGSYELISVFKKIPLIGELIFSVMDYFQRIKPLYPRRDLSPTTMQQRIFFRAIKRGLGKNLIEELNKNPLPLVTTFFVPAYFAEYYGYKGEIYCVVCDADVSRAWAPLSPKNSRVKYLATTPRAQERLKLYGVPEKNIFLTGFPLPSENVGPQKEIVGFDLANRLRRLDIDGNFREHYAAALSGMFIDSAKMETAPVSITFAVGGAGAQKEIGVLIMKALREDIVSGRIALNLVAGSRMEIKEFFDAEIKKLGLTEPGVKIIFAPDKYSYFRVFNETLRSSDILWTKPSELSLYSGLGLPILMSEPVGSQEDFNRAWLLEIGAGIDAPATGMIRETLSDLLASGRLALAAWNAYLNAPKMGTYQAEKLVLENVPPYEEIIPLI